ncbi:MAG: HAD-IIB family hydrolase [Shimia sp.]
MRIMHIALGGCLKAPPIDYGLTEDTGGHIAYVLGAAGAQAARREVERVDIVTRAFDDAALGAVHARPEEAISPSLRILRLRGATPGYVSKAELAADVPALTAAFLEALPTWGLPDVIHAHFGDAAQLARAAAERFGIRWLYTPHALGLDKARELARGGLDQRVAWERAAIRSADAVIASTRDEAERQVRDYDAEACARVHTVPPGVTTDVGAQGVTPLHPAGLAALDDPRKPIVLAIARPVEKKNLGGVLAAYARSPALREAANLVILAGQARPGVPRGAEEARVVRALHEGVAAHGLSGRVALPASHGRADVRALYALAARDGVFVNPALHEPFGLTLLEAAAFGAPFVATRHGGPPDIVERLGAGDLIDPRDPDALAAACLRVLRDPAPRQAARAARGHVAARFSWEQWADRVARIVAPEVPRPRHAPTRLLASDVDGTLTGDARGIAAFRAWRAARGRDTAFAVATGRSLSDVRTVIAEWSIPSPDVFITSVGTEVWWWRDGQLRRDGEFAHAIAPGWDAERVSTLIARAGLAPQPAHDQRRWKRSAFGTATDADRLRALLREADVEGRVIVSHGRLIDVIPALAGKGAAMLHVARALGLTGTDCIAAGDSGNDVDMLCAAHRAIIPANGLAEIAGLSHPGLIRASASHAAGVVEGLMEAAPAPRAEAAE